MRLALFIGLPWLVTFMVTAALLLVESSLARKREAAEAARNPDDVAVPFKAPGVGLYLGLSLLFGFLVVPVFFWVSRRSFVGLLIGIAASVLVIVSTGAASFAGRAVVARAERGSYVDACEKDQKARYIPINGCRGVAESLDTGTYCVDRLTEPTPCPGKISMSVTPSPEQATRIYMRTCVDGFNHHACKTLETRPGLSEADRAKAAAKLKEICAQPYNASMCSGLSGGFVF